MEFNQPVGLDFVGTTGLMKKKTEPIESS